MIVRNIINKIAKISASQEIFVATDNGYANKSEPLIFTGDLTQALVTPAPGQRLDIKGITITGDGNTGTVFIKRQNGPANKIVILPVWFSAQNRGGASGALNFTLDTDESIIVEATGRGSNQTFVGVSYIELTNGGDLE